jgi:ABC-type nitrate/sulfonate/bicarbonate transport system substrate-binding protein
MASIATTDALIEKSPETAAAAVRAIVATQKALKEDPGLATQAAQLLFPPSETALIRQLIERDLPYYDASISPEFVAGMNKFAHDVGISDGQAPYERVVATQFSGLWK